MVAYQGLSVGSHCWKVGHSAIRYKSSFCFLTYENVAVYRPEKAPSLRNVSVKGNVILKFPSSRTVSTKYLLIKPPVYGNLLWQPKQSKICESLEKYLRFLLNLFIVFYVMLLSRVFLVIGLDIIMYIKILSQSTGINAFCQLM